MRSINRLTTCFVATLVLLTSGLASARSSPDDSKPLVLVAGATGGTGQEVVDRAIERGYRVRALVRDETKARTLFDDRVQYVTGDVREPRTLRRAMKGVNQVSPSDSAQ